MLKELSNEFITFYRTKVKDLAVLCSKDFKVMYEIEKKGKKYADDSPEILRIKSLHDFEASWYIGYMVSDIEYAIFHGSGLNLINSLSQVRGCLNSESYWLDVWKNDTSTEEAQNLKKLAPLMNELISYL